MGSTGATARRPSRLTERCVGWRTPCTGSGSRIGRDPRSRRVPPIERDQAPVERELEAGREAGDSRDRGWPAHVPFPHPDHTVVAPAHDPPSVGAELDCGHGTLRPRENDRRSAPGQIPYAHGMRKVADRDVPSVATRGNGPDHAPGAKHTSRRRPIAGPHRDRAPARTGDRASVSTRRERIHATNRQPDGVRIRRRRDCDACLVGPCHLAGIRVNAAARIGAARPEDLRFRAGSPAPAQHLAVTLHERDRVRARECQSGRFEALGTEQDVDKLVWARRGRRTEAERGRDRLARSPPVPELNPSLLVDRADEAAVLAERDLDCSRSTGRLGANVLRRRSRHRQHGRARAFSSSRAHDRDGSILQGRCDQLPVRAERHVVDEPPDPLRLDGDLSSHSTGEDRSPECVVRFRRGSRLHRLAGEQQASLGIYRELRRRGERQFPGTCDRGLIPRIVALDERENAERHRNRERHADSPDDDLEPTLLPSPTRDQELGLQLRWAWLRPIGLTCQPRLGRIEVSTSREHAPVATLCVPAQGLQQPVAVLPHPVEIRSERSVELGQGLIEVVVGSHEDVLARRELLGRRVDIANHEGYEALP